MSNFLVFVCVFVWRWCGRIKSKRLDVLNVFCVFCWSVCLHICFCLSIRYALNKSLPHANSVRFNLRKKWIFFLQINAEFDRINAIAISQMVSLFFCSISDTVNMIGLRLKYTFLSPNAPCRVHIYLLCTFRVNYSWCSSSTSSSSSHLIRYVYFIQVFVFVHFRPDCMSLFFFTTYK